MKDIRGEIREWIQAILIAVVISMIIRIFLFETTLVYGQSMELTLHTKDRVIINKITYHFNPPNRGDIVVFKNPNKNEENYVKRIIALPGDTIEIIDEIVYINDEPLEEAYVYFDRPGEDYFPRSIVPPGTIFVMGDNRNHSLDSRNPDVGFVPMDNIIGKAQLRIWPLREFTYFK